MLDVPLANIFETLRIYLGSAYVNDFNAFGRTYRVTAQADAPYRLDKAAIAQLKVRSAERRHRSAGLACHVPRYHGAAAHAAL